MEYLENGDLGNYINNPIPETEAAGIIRQLLEGLGYMHESGFVHRDLKPEVCFERSHFYTLVSTMLTFMSPLRMFW
jgi:tRNA A-37 threonylcarbamoyl transferase component Bud32